MAQSTGTETLAPILLDLGQVKGKDVREFKDGRGKLVGDLQQVLAEVRQTLGPDAANKELVPIVIVYRKKRKGRSKKSGSGLFPF